MTSGQLIKAERKKAGLTQRELGQRIGVTYQTIAQWENDLRNPKYETLLKIANALDIDVMQLFTDRESEIAEFGNIDGWCRAIDFYKLDEFKKLGYTRSNLEVNMISLFNELNSEGQKKAIERIEELTEIPRYKGNSKK